MRKALRKVVSWLALPAFATAMFWLEVPKKVYDLVATIFNGPRIVLQPAELQILYTPTTELVIIAGLTAGNKGEHGDQITLHTARLHHKLAPPIGNERYIPLDEGHFAGEGQPQALELEKDRRAFPASVRLTWPTGVLSRSAFPQAGRYRMELLFKDSEKKDHELEMCFQLTNGEVAALQRGDFAKAALKPAMVDCKSKETKE